MKGILFFDIDGTLVDSEHNEHLPSASARCAIALAKRNGYLCMISSGRSLFGLQSFRHIGMDGYIFADGAGFLAEGEEAMLDPIDPQVLKRLMVQVVEEYHGEMLMSSMTGCYASDGQYAVMRAYIEMINRSGASDVVSMKHLEEYTDDPILEIDVTFPDQQTEDRWLEHLDPALEFVSTTASYGRGGQTAGEVTAKGMTKGNRARMVAEMYGVGIEQTYAFGDSMNDASMIRSCGHGIAMGNGAEELKELAEYVTEPIDREGLAKAMMHYGLIGKEEYDEELSVF